MTTPLLLWPLRAVPIVRVAGRFPLDDQDFEFTYRHATHALHMHEYNGLIRMRGCEYDLQPGDVTVSVAHVRTQYHLPRAGHHWCVHFVPVTRRAETMRLPWHIRNPSQRRYVADRIAEIARCHGEPKGTPASGRAGILLQDLLLWLGETSATTTRLAHAATAMDRLVAVLDERFAEPWTVPQLAGIAGLSQDHLARCFRRRLGVTIPRYLLQRRVAHARHLLEITDLPVKRIAERVGMPDPQHFNKQFRLVTGFSPSAARSSVPNKHPAVKPTTPHHPRTK
jgi:AraC-like DNA-binding protein